VGEGTSAALGGDAVDGAGLVARAGRVGGGLT